MSDVGCWISGALSQPPAPATFTETPEIRHPKSEILYTTRVEVARCRSRLALCDSAFADLLADHRALGRARRVSRAERRPQGPRGGSAGGAGVGASCQPGSEPAEPGNPRPGSGIQPKRRASEPS